MKVRPDWADGLPLVKGTWGFEKETMMDTQLAVRKKGSMDEDLFIDTMLAYKALYPNLAPRFKWEGGQAH
jgi:hypothetical protein